MTPNDSSGSSMIRTSIHGMKWMIALLCCIPGTTGGRYGDPDEFWKLIVPLVISFIIFFILLALLLFFYRKHVAKRVCGCWERNMGCGCKYSKEEQEPQKECYGTTSVDGAVNVAFDADNVAFEAKNVDFDAANVTFEAVDVVFYSDNVAVGADNVVFSIDEEAPNENDTSDTTLMKDTNSINADSNIQNADSTRVIINADPNDGVADSVGKPVKTNHCKEVCDCLDCKCQSCVCRPPPTARLHRYNCEGDHA